MYRCCGSPCLGWQKLELSLKRRCDLQDDSRPPVAALYTVVYAWSLKRLCNLIVLRSSRAPSCTNQPDSKPNAILFKFKTIVFILKTTWTLRGLRRFVEPFPHNPALVKSLCLKKTGDRQTTTHYIYIICNHSGVDVSPIAWPISWDSQTSSWQIWHCATVVPFLVCGFMSQRPWRFSYNFTKHENV